MGAVDDPYEGEMDLGPLQGIADRHGVTDIVVTCDGKVWADWGSGLRQHIPQIPFRTPHIVREYATQLCAQLGRRLDDACPIADASTVGGVRVHAVIAPLVPYGAAISIRFPQRGGLHLEQLQALGMFPRDWLDLLRSLVRRRASILITGGTGAGKTTLLRALLRQCPEEERIVSVEEVRELGDIGHADYVSLATREANVEGAGAVGLPELVKATLRMRPDRVVLGECRGEELADVLRAFSSGHRGGLVTLHADCVERVPARMIALGLLSGLSAPAVTALAPDSFDVVIHLQRHRGVRRIAQVGYLTVKEGSLTGISVARWDGRNAIELSSGWRDFSKRWE
ncbi:Type II/IV secretion system protein [Bifidobacterium tsurumiense]|uniref:Type II/IV secretion system protein n=2 Tax=Bifidobacterium tsurumiense TaxID=356829 RepID=A0A087E928_9BIFI|nr:Type II/IV secretion system protein [Bifidobacterium tsurumiense]